MGHRCPLAPGAGGLIFGGLVAGARGRVAPHLGRPDPRSVRDALAVTPRAEDRAAHPNMGGPMGNRGLKIAAHPHRQTG